MKYQFWAASAALCSLLPVTAALADYDVAPSVSGNKLVTGAFSDDVDDYVPNVRVFDFDFGEDVTQPYFIQDPGFHPQPGSGLTPGSSLSAVNFGTLSFWNGSGAVAFGAPQKAETLNFRLGSGSITVGNTAPAGALTIEPNTPSSGSFDDHLESRLAANTGNPTDGIYLTSLQLQTSTAGVTNSPAVYLLFVNGADDDAVDAAKEYVRDNFAPGTNLAPLPEPGSLALLSLGGLALRRRRRA